jgi:phosphoribosylformylglycinamidine synthase
MWQLSESIDGMAEACLALGIPVVGGNVSLYNASEGIDIDPTPVVATVGLVEHVTRRPPTMSWNEGDDIVLLGRTVPNLGGSRWARQLRHHLDGELAWLDLDLHRRLVTLVARLVSAEAGPAEAPGLISGLHDVADGGLGVALAELAVASGVGCSVRAITTHQVLFSESPSRVLIASPRSSELVAIAAGEQIEASVIGIVGGSRLLVDGLVDLALDELDTARRAHLADVFDGPVTPA